MKTILSAPRRLGRNLPRTVHGAKSARSRGMGRSTICQMYGHKREHDPQLSAVLDQRAG